MASVATFKIIDDEGGEHTVRIEDGVASFVYSDKLAGIVKALNGTVTRASHVEPHPTKTGWLADMRPSGGPVLGLGDHVWVSHRSCDCDECALKVAALTGYPLREDALAAEREWLRKEKGL